METTSTLTKAQKDFCIRHNITEDQFFGKEKNRR
jgi:hypothetical protein